MLRNGGAIAWSDAIFPLTDYLKKNRAGYIFCLDWGYLDTLRVLSDNRLPVRVGSDPISKPELTGDDRETLAELIGNPNHLFVTHTKGLEFFPGISDKLIRYAQNVGYQAETLAVIPDSYGRPTFEVYRFGVAAIIPTSALRSDRPSRPGEPAPSTPAAPPRRIVNQPR
jgi:hypothetical protein